MTESLTRQWIAHSPGSALVAWPETAPAIQRMHPGRALARMMWPMNNVIDWLVFDRGGALVEIAPQKRRLERWAQLTHGSPETFALRYLRVDDHQASVDSVKTSVGGLYLCIDAATLGTQMSALSIRSGEVLS